MPEFVKVAKVGDVPPGEVRGFDVGNARILIANVSGQFYAMGAECTHQSGPLDEGFLEENLLMCPWHAGQFDVTTGLAAGPPASDSVPTYQVRIAGQDLEVERPG